MRAILAALGSAAIEGPVISWVADHRKHHAFSDQPGDPHSPHVDHGHGLKGALRGLLHAHLGWLFIHTERGLKTRYAPDLIADPVVSFINRTFVLWVFAGLAVPFLLGWLIGGTIAEGLTGLLWGGAVRMLVLHHATYSINSLCHFFGKRPFETGDESRNLAWLSLFTFGEAWHNSHHAFPTSARHGLGRWQLRPLRLGHLGAREDRPGVGRRAHRPRAPGRQARDVSGTASSAPRSREALPGPPVRASQLWDGTHAAARPTAAVRPSASRRPRRSATSCARRASSASAAPTSAAGSTSTTWTRRSR